MGVGRPGNNTTIFWDVSWRCSLNCTDFWRNPLPLSVTQWTVPAGSSETSGHLSQSTRRRFLEDHNLGGKWHENLNSRTLAVASNSDYRLLIYHKHTHTLQSINLSSVR